MASIIMREELKDFITQTFEETLLYQ